MNCIYLDRVSSLEPWDLRKTVQTSSSKCRECSLLALAAPRFGSPGATSTTLSSESKRADWRWRMLASSRRMSQLPRCSFPLTALGEDGPGGLLLRRNHQRASSGWRDRLPRRSCNPHQQQLLDRLRRRPLHGWLHCYGWLPLFALTTLSCTRRLHVWSLTLLQALRRYFWQDKCCRLAPTSAPWWSASKSPRREDCRMFTQIGHTPRILTSRRCTGCTPQGESCAGCCVRGPS